MSDAGVTILDASFPETLEVETEAQPDLFLSAFRYFFKRDKKLPPVMRDLTRGRNQGTAGCVRGIGFGGFDGLEPVGV